MNVQQEHSAHAGRHTRHLCASQGFYDRAFCGDRLPLRPPPPPGASLICLQGLVMTVRQEGTPQTFTHIAQPPESIGTSMLLNTSAIARHTAITYSSRQKLTPQNSTITRLQGSSTACKYTSKLPGCCCCAATFAVRTLHLLG